MIMHWSNITYVFHKEGWKRAIKIAIWGWVILPWKKIRIKVAYIILSILRVKEYITETPSGRERALKTASEILDLVKKAGYVRSRKGDIYWTREQLSAPDPAEGYYKE